MAEQEIYRIYVGGEIASHVCAACGKLEIEEARVASYFFWLCPECLDKLRRIMQNAEP